MNMWSLGWMLENAQNSSDYKAKGYTGAKVQTNEIDPAKTMEFKAIQDQLMKMSVSQFAHNKANAAAVATYKKGLEQFYKIVNISKTTTGLTYSYDSQNGKISYHSAAVTVDPNKATDKTNKTAVVNGQDNKKPVTAKDTTQK